MTGPGDLLDEAAVVLHDRGWLQGRPCEEIRTGRGKVCVVGALNVAATGDPRTPPSKGHRHFDAHLEARVALGRKVGTLSLTCWNDAAGRRGLDVRRALQRAADEVRDLGRAA